VNREGETAAGFGGVLRKEGGLLKQPNIPKTEDAKKG